MKIIYAFSFILFTFICTDHLHAQCFTDQNFTNMGTYSYTLPGSATDTYIVEIECVGADGAPSLLNGTMPNQGGSGANMTAEFQLYGGNELTVFVGQAGQTGGNPAGGGGAGGSAVIVDAANVLIAAGGGGGAGLGGASGVGGGGGANTNSPPQGGTGAGAPGGGGFNSPGANGQAGTGGGAGTLTSTGAGGMGGVVAGMGGMGFGGGGGGAGTVGGGAGGYEGGAGGLQNVQGGMGGDSYVSTFYHSTVVSAIPGITGGGNQSNGSVLITCISAGGGNPTLVAMIDAITNPDCGGATNGSITASASGGVPPYEYSIDGTNFSSDNTFTGLGAGTYTITVMDADAATATADTTLIDPSSVSGTIIEVVDNACFGGMTGSVEISGSGGAGGYTYSIDGVNFQSSGLFENLVANTYTITIQDANGCAGMITATVGEPAVITINATTIDVNCHGESTGLITVLSITGGTGPFQYSLDGVIFQSDPTFTDLPAATYTVTVMDAMGCMGEVAVTIEEPDLIILTASGTNAGCGGQGGTIVANATGGVTPYIFTLNGTTTSTDGIFENLPADDYDVEVTDANGCSMMIIVTIGLSSGDPVALTLIEQGNLMCFGDGNGSITVSATGGTTPYIYSLDTAMNSSGVFNNLGAGVYEISITDSVGCMASISVELTQPDELQLSIDTLVHVLCADNSDGFAQFSASGGVPPYTFIVGDSMSGTGTFTNLSPGNHTVTVRDAHLCSEVTTFMINILNPIEIFNYATVDNICFGESNGSATVVIFGNSQYEVVLSGDTMTAINNDTITFNNLPAGQHDITASDIEGCSETLAIAINEPDELLLSVANYIAPTDTTNGEITLSASGGVAPYEFSIDNGTTFQSSPTFSDLTLGNYEFTVRDANDCLKTLEYIISSISDIEYLSSQILLSPNPTRDHINITSLQDFDNIKLSIHNRLGQLVYSENISQLHADAKSIQINCHSFSPGVYSLKLQTYNGVAFKQFMVVNE